MGSQEIPRDVNFRALIACLVLAIICTASRTAARWFKDHSFAIEDYLCWLATASYISFIGLYISILPTIYPIKAVATGLPVPPAELAAFQCDGNHMMWLMFATQLLFWVTLYSVKLSLMWLFRRLLVGLPIYEKAWLGVLVFTLLSFVGSVVSELMSCMPLSKFFHFGECTTYKIDKAEATSLYVSLAVDLLTDILIMAIPVHLFWNLQISRIEKIGVVVGSCVGVITMICAIVRASSLGDFASGGQFPMPWFLLWSAIHGFAAVAVNGLPAFAIFIRKQVGSHHTGTNYFQNTLSSPQNSRTPEEGVLWGDVALRDARRSTNTCDESESLEHNYMAQGSKVTTFKKTGRFVDDSLDTFRDQLNHNP